MFQPETEDMLPRMAPKPSPDVPSGSSEGIIRPQVPEVSILFGQQNANLQQQILNVAPQEQTVKTIPQQTYAAWKKQMLPKVTYPASANLVDIQSQENNMIHDYHSSRTNLYPSNSNTTPPVNMISNVNSNGSGGSINATNHMPYRRSLESCNNVYHLPTLPSQPPLSQLPKVGLRDVLTICAGTQTDAILDTTNILHLESDLLSNLASKKDVEDIRKYLEELKTEQQRSLKILETILFTFHSQMKKTQSRDIGVQVDCIVNGDSACVNSDIRLVQHQQPVPKFVQNLKPCNKIETHKGKCIAQSTTYRPNSPHTKHDFLELVPVTSNQQVSYKPIPIMAKTASDTSLAMNELALKYLPNEKLVELLNDLNIDCPLAVTTTNVPTTPLRLNIDKFKKSSSDISNASYKYLKKYRLLPEEHEEYVNNVVEGAVMENGNENQTLKYNSPQYEKRNTPKNQRQTPTKKCSPFAGCLPLAPLGKASPPFLQSAEHIVDLENIKHRPKFL